MKQHQPKAILFDWDGTLAETRTAVVEAMEYTLALYKKEPWNITKQKYRDTSKSLKENFPNFFGINYQHAYENYLEYYTQFSINKIQPTQGAKEFLNLCLQNNIDIYIISNKEKSLLLKEIKYCFTDIRFNNILGNGDAPKNKPAPDSVFTALTTTAYQINSTNVWLIGDSKQDTDCAIAAGICPILIGNGKFMNQTEIDLQLSENKITQVHDFYELIEKINNRKIK